jgi:hypothetical protein
MTNRQDGRDSEVSGSGERSLRFHKEYGKYAKDFDGKLSMTTRGHCID